MGKFKLFSTSARLFCFVGITFSETDMDYYGKSYSFTVVYLCYPTKAKNFKKKKAVALRCHCPDDDLSEAINGLKDAYNVELYSIYMYMFLIQMYSISVSIWTSRITAAFDYHWSNSQITKCILVITTVTRPWLCNILTHWYLF